MSQYDTNIDVAIILVFIVLVVISGYFFEITHALFGYPEKEIIIEKEDK